ncbi:MAG: pyridoxal phosphate-dependent decarboxylase family protein [Candidatus Bipolaricaulia bacterium]
MTDLLKTAAERASLYLEGLDERRVAPSTEAIDRLEKLGGPLPDKPTDPEAVLSLLDDIGSPATVTTAGRRYFGFVIGGVLPAALAANWLAGAFDPAHEICAMAHEAGAWVHVDGAFGLWIAAAPERSHLTHGVADAGSWAFDTHKWLNVPYDSGVVICRHAESLRAAMSFSAAYLMQGEQREPHQYTPEMSRRARGIEMWAALRSLGRSGLADLIERTCRHASRFAEGLSAAGCRILNDVVTNQVLVSFGDEETTRRVIAGVQKDGTCWCGGTVWQGHVAMRISVSSWATTEADVDRSLAAILRVAAEQSQR